MEVRGQHRYTENIDTVFATFGNPEYIQAKYAALGARNIHIKTLSLTEQSLDLEVQREVPVEAPSMLKKFIGEWNQLMQIEHWTGEPGKQYSCKLNIETKGAPVKITGTMNLRREGEGCVNDVVLSIVCKIPLVGGKLADFIGANSKDAMQAEYEFLTQYLAQHS